MHADVWSYLDDWEIKYNSSKEMLLWVNDRMIAKKQKQNKKKKNRASHK